MTRAARWSIAVVLTAAVVVVYLPVADFGFVSFDDPEYVTQNRHVRAGLGWSGIETAAERV